MTAPDGVGPARHPQPGDRLYRPEEPLFDPAEDRVLDLYVKRLGMTRERALRSWITMKNWLPALLRVPVVANPTAP